MELQTIERSGKAEPRLMLEVECADAVLGVTTTMYEPILQPELMLGQLAKLDGHNEPFLLRHRHRNIAGVLLASHACQEELRGPQCLYIGRRRVSAVETEAQPLVRHGIRTHGCGIRG